MSNPIQVSQEGFADAGDADAMQKNEQMTLFDLKSVAVRETDTIDTLRHRLKEANEMYQDIFNNNPMLAEKKKELTEYSKGMKSLKTQVERTAEAARLKEKIGEIKDDIKRKMETVSTAALEVYRQTGETEFTDENGTTFEIRTVAKVVKRKQ